MISIHYLLKAAKIRVRTTLERSYVLGEHAIKLPRGHMLDWYRFRNPRYDEPIRQVAELIAAYRGQVVAIDVGANVGDSAALMATSPNVAVLCVEGSDSYFRYLTANVKAFCLDAEFDNRFIGEVSGELQGQISRSSGTASIALDPNHASSVRFATFDQILEDHPKFREANFLKIDTDGYDPVVIRSAQRFLAAKHPIMFFEVDPTRPTSSKAIWQETLSRLTDLGYVSFHVFDNFGSHMMRLELDQLTILDSLMDYVILGRKLPRPSIYYFDFCALSGEDARISSALLAAGHASPD